MSTTQMDVEISYQTYIRSFSLFIISLAKFFHHNGHRLAGTRSRMEYLVFRLFLSTNGYTPYRRATELVRLTREITAYGIERQHLQGYEEADVLYAARKTLFLKRSSDPEERRRRLENFFALLAHRRERKKQAFMRSMARNRYAARFAYMIKRAQQQSIPE